MFESLAVDKRGEKGAMGEREGQEGKGGITDQVGTYRL